MGGLYWVTPEQKERPPWARMPGESQHAEERSAKNHWGRCAAPRRAAPRTEARDYNNSLCIRVHARHKCTVVLFNSTRLFSIFSRNNTSGCGKSRLFPTPLHLLLIYLIRHTFPSIFFLKILRKCLTKVQFSISYYNSFSLFFKEQNVKLLHIMPKYFHLKIF